MCRPIKILSIVVCGLIFGCAIWGLVNIEHGWLWILGMIVMPLLIVGLSALFAVNGYSIEGDLLIIHRPFWKTSLDLSGLIEVTVDPHAMEKSWRLWGNGGLFCAIGWFRNKKLGTYRAWVTDPGRAVIMKLGNKVIVLSPDEPERLYQLLINRC